MLLKYKVFSGYFIFLQNRLEHCFHVIILEGTNEIIIEYYAIYIYYIRGLYTLYILYILSSWDYLKGISKY